MRDLDLSMKNLLSIFVASLALAMITGCGGSGGGSSSSPSLRIVHGSQDAGNVDVSVNSASVATNLAYTGITPSVATSPITVDAGITGIDIFQTGTTTVLQSGLPNLRNGHKYTYVLAGLQSDVSTRSILVDDTTASLSASSVNLRFVHATTQVGAVDVYVTAPAADISSLSPSLSNISRYNVSTLVQLTAGQYRVRVCQTGTKTVEAEFTSSLSANSYGVVFLRNGTSSPSVSAFTELL